jgi:RHS repeat-associated protein
VKEYVWGVQYIDEIVARDDDTGTDGTLDRSLYYVQDANWNVVTLADDDAEAVERYLYDPYGVPSVFDGSWGSLSGSAFANQVLYTGRWWVAGTYSHDYRNREYSPYLGRFLQRDPIGVWADDLNSGNGHTYSGHQPLTRVDPFGNSASAGSDGSEEEQLCYYWYHTEHPQCCGPDTHGNERKKENCFYLAIYNDSRGDGKGHASVGDSLDPRKHWGFYGDGWNRETNKGNPMKSLQSVWECCCLSDAEMDSFRDRLAGIESLCNSGTGKGLKGERYKIKPFGVGNTCASEAARAASGLGCPDLTADTQKPFKLERALESNPYCKKAGEAKPRS